MTSPRTVGRTLLKNEEILRNEQHHAEAAHLSLKEAIPYIETAAKRLSACRREYRAGVKCVSLSTRTPRVSARRAHELQIATRSQHWSLADDNLKEINGHLANIGATREDLVCVSGDVTRLDKCAVCQRWS
jgi:hypothetical protein